MLSAYGYYDLPASRRRAVDGTWRSVVGDGARCEWARPVVGVAIDEVGGYPVQRVALVDDINGKLAEEIQNQNWFDKERQPLTATSDRGRQPRRRRTAGARLCRGRAAAFRSVLIVLRSRHDEQRIVIAFAIVSNQVRHCLAVVA